MASCLFAGVGLSSTVYWDGGGNGTNWNDPLNWSGHVVPAPTNDVVIDVSDTNITVTIVSNVTIRSVQCQESLFVAAGSLTVTNGNSVIAGSLTVANGCSLTASGMTLTLTA